MVAVAYKRWSFTKSSSYKALTRKKEGTGGLATYKVVAHGGSTVFITLSKRKSNATYYAVLTRQSRWMQFMRMNNN